MDGGCAEPPDHGLGRSRGGLCSKQHLIIDGPGRPISVGLTGGDVNDTTMLEPALGELRVPRRGRGRPRSRPDGLLGDKGYSSRANRQRLARLGITATIPERADQLANRVLPAVQDDDVDAIHHDDETRTSRAVLIITLAAWPSR